MKLILEEDEFVATVPQPQPVEQIETQPSPETLVTSSMINGLIKGEWDAIDLYNGILSVATDEVVKSTITDIIAEEYVHVGQLEKLLQSINCTACSIDKGEAEFAEEENKPEAINMPTVVSTIMPDIITQLSDEKHEHEHYEHEHGEHDHHHEHGEHHGHHGHEHHDEDEFAREDDFQVRVM